MAAATSLSPEVMAAVDKMAEFKVRNGAAFESLIKERQRDNPNFSFPLRETQEMTCPMAYLFVLKITWKWWN